MSLEGLLWVPVSAPTVPAFILILDKTKLTPSDLLHMARRMSGYCEPSAWTRLCYVFRQRPACPEPQFAYL